MYSSKVGATRYIETLRASRFIRVFSLNRTCAGKMRASPKNQFHWLLCGWWDLEWGTRAFVCILFVYTTRAAHPTHIYLTDCTKWLNAMHNMHYLYVNTGIVYNIVHAYTAAAAECC